MIKANELRLNNYYDYNGVIRQITLNVILEVWEAERIWCKPIPLTEEWLVRLGFENKYGFLSLGLLSCIWGEEEACYYVYYGEDKNNEIKIRYLHQLQNLYFALTGEELTLTAYDN